MKAPFDFVIEPKGNRYNNTTKVGDKDLVLNTEVYNHQFVNREAIVKSVPTAFKTEIKPGDTIITHHNIFRRWHDVRGNEKNSRSYFDENTYFAKEDQVFLYKRNGEWKAPKGYCFVQPIKDRTRFGFDREESCIGIVKHTDGTYNKGDLVGFTPFSTYEFVVDGEKVYRMFTENITMIL